MTTIEAKVSFYDTREPAFDAVLSVADGELSIEVSGRAVGSWPIGFLSPALVDDSIIVSLEGERLLIETPDLAVLRSAFRFLESDSDPVLPLPRGLPPLYSPEADERTSRSAARGRHVAPTRRSTDARVHAETDISIDLRVYEEPAGPDQTANLVSALRTELRDLENSLAAARTQLHWVKDLTPRRLPIMVRADESGLGVVQGVRLKERLESSESSAPWVAVDWGNVYVTDRRLVFSGDSHIDFEFSKIERKGASRNGLLLGVSTRDRAHILEGPGERLAVVLTAAEKIAIGLDPTLPFKETISRLMVEVDTLSQRLAAESELSAYDAHALNVAAHSA